MEELHGQNQARFEIFSTPEELLDWVARITAPSESWRVVDKSSPGSTVIGFEPPDTNNLGLHFLAFPSVLHVEEEAFRIGRSRQPPMGG